nr:MAG TPA: hypothetical protein [Caudoviricetes sp.]
MPTTSGIRNIKNLGIICFGILSLFFYFLARNFPLFSNKEITALHR